jgi:hypothetical protein
MQLLKTNGIAVKVLKSHVPFFIVITHWWSNSFYVLLNGIDLYIDIVVKRDMGDLIAYPNALQVASVVSCDHLCSLQSCIFT